MQAVDRFIRKHALIQKGATVLVGVSGGPDSMALLHYLLEKRAVWRLTLVAVHVNHLLRGDESKRDQQYVESFCHKNDILFAGTEIDVQSYKEKHHLSVQVAARECRYRFFAEMMETYHADYLALGHHGDDQIETMLMRQVRGAFGIALAGIPVKREFSGGFLIRPFLCLSKEEIEHYLKEKGIKPRRDSSNDRDDYVRNRFRHELLPFLKKENPNVHLRFQQQSETIFRDESHLMNAAKKEFKNVIEKNKQGDFIVHLLSFQTIAPALQRRVIHLLLNCLYPSMPKTLSFIHIEQIMQLFLSESPSGRLHLPDGLRVIRSYDRALFSFQKETDRHYRFIFDIPSTLVLPEGILRGRITSTMPDITDERSDFFADADQIVFPLTVRSRKAGDRMTLKGMNGTKKIKDIFIDEKIDRNKRTVIPVVEDAKGRILWLAGVKRSKIALVTAKTVRFLHLSYDEFDGDHREDFETT